jgi:hypothetical protein
LFRKEHFRGGGRGEKHYFRQNYCNYLYLTNIHIYLCNITDDVVGNQRPLNISDGDNREIWRIISERNPREDRIFLSGVDRTEINACRLQTLKRKRCTAASPDWRQQIVTEKYGLSANGDECPGG